MQLPETENAHYIHAFKKGYRLALEGKPLSNMPSSFRYDRTLRVYYEQGWSQANEELEAGYQASTAAPWRNRMAWFVVMIIGSIVTAIGLINGVHKEQAEQQALILSSQQTNPPLQLNSQPNPVVPEPIEPSKGTIPLDPSKPLESLNLAKPNPVENESLLDPQGTDIQSSNTQDSELTLLTDQQRNDLVLNQQEAALQSVKQVTLRPITASNIQIETAILSSNIINKQPSESLGHTIPKQIRTVYFFNQLKGAENTVIYHRWIYKNQEMALIPLTINSNLYRTWSSKQMTSAWQGPWIIEILNENKDVIYRHTFKYGNG